MKRINLLPQEERAQGVPRAWAHLGDYSSWSPSWWCSGLVYVKLNSDVSAKQDELAEIQAQTAEVQAKIAELSPYAALQAQRTAMTETSRAIYQSSVPFSILLQELSLRDPGERTPAVAAGDRTAGHAAGRGCRGRSRRAAPTAVDITFTGQTEEHRDVAEFMTRLGLIPQLMDIVLTNSDRPDLGDGDRHGHRSGGDLRAVHRDIQTAAVHDAASHDPVAGGDAMRARGREIYIITAVVAVVLVVAWYFLLFSPKQRELSDLDQQVQSARSELTAAQAEVEQLESYKKTAPQSRAEIVRLGKMLPAAEGMPGLIIELSKTAEASGVDVTSIARGAIMPGNPFGIQQVTLQVSGRYFDVEDFLYRLEEFVAFRNASFRVTGRLLQVTTLQMQPISGAAVRRVARADRQRGPQRVSLGRSGAEPRQLEVRNEAEPAHAGLYRHRTHRRRGARARGRPG